MHMGQLLPVIINSPVLLYEDQILSEVWVTWFAHLCKRKWLEQAMVLQGKGQATAFG